MTLPPGRYYVGDLCYVLQKENDDTWDVICDTGDTNGFNEDVAGMSFYMFSTAYGDGEYEDQQGRKYAVDSGSIGCVHEKHVSNKEDVDARVLGHWIDFAYPFTCSTNEDNTMNFGDEVIIETKDLTQYNSDGNEVNSDGDEIDSDGDVIETEEEEED